MADMNDDSEFQTALEQVLRPLARAMVNQSVTIAQATELLKKAYVSAVLEVEPDGPTDSRISVLTGLHRKDVKRLRSSDPRPPRRPMLNASALVIAVWSTASEFTDEDGTPLPLERAGEPGFDDLVKKARIDVPASTLLKALLEQDLVSQPQEKSPYVLNRRDLAGSDDLSIKLMAFEKNLSAHLEVVADNLASHPAPHFERGAHFNQLSQSSIDKLEQEARLRLQQVMIDLNNMALQLQDEDGDPDAEGRFSIGAFIRGYSDKKRSPDDA